MSLPVERAGIDDDPANGRAVAAYPLRGGVHNDVCTMVLYAAEVSTRAEGVVDLLYS